MTPLSNIYIHFYFPCCVFKGNNNNIKIVIVSSIIVFELIVGYARSFV